MTKDERDQYHGKAIAALTALGVPNARGLGDEVRGDFERVFDRMPTLDEYQVFATLKHKRGGAITNELIDELVRGCLQ